MSGLARIFKADIKYAKAGVMLLSLQPDTHQQTELALEDDDSDLERGKLMTSLDDLNVRFGRGTVLMASAGLDGEQRAWSMKQERMTPCYTTRWEDMPVART